MPDDPKPNDDPKPEDKPTPDPDEGAKKALDAERKARREAEAKLKDVTDRLTAIEDKDKSEVDRLTGKVAQLEKDLASATAKADRYEVALDKGLDMTRAKRLTGTTREELEADAEELAGWTAPGKGGSGGGGTPAKPVEDLGGGGDPTEEPEETDPRKLAAGIPRL